MTGLFSGIIGSLIGAGIQATIGGIPIREDASNALDVLRRGGLPIPPENWFSQQSSNEERTQQAYGKIGQHVTGAMQMLGPCMQIAKALGDAAYPRSQPQTLKACMPEKELPRSKTSYESPKINDPCRLLIPGMMAKSSTSSVNNPIKNNCKPRKASYSESIERMGNKKTKKTANKCGENSKNGADPLAKDKLLCQGNGKNGKTGPREQHVKADKFTNTAGISKNLKPRPSGRSSTGSKQSHIPNVQTKMFKSQNKSEMSFHGKKCLICQAQIKEIKKSPLLPCGHIVCYKCLTGKTLLKCPKCGLKF